MMRALVYLPVLAVSWFAACAELADEGTADTATGSETPDIENVGRIGSNRIGSNRIGSNRLSANRIGSNRLSANRIGDVWVGARRMRVNMAAADMLLATPGGRELFAVLVACALPDDITLVATVGGKEFEFVGEMNLAAQWLFVPLDRSGQGWVSACTFAKVNAHDVAVEVSFRGPRVGLDTNRNAAARARRQGSSAASSTEIAPSPIPHTPG
jgi:hypothetical protein